MLIPMRSSWTLVGAAVLAPLACQRPPAPAAGSPVELPQVSAGALRAPGMFDVYGEPQVRSRALFVEASRVMLHSRCSNCHPSGDVPLQRAGELHDPPVARGPEDRGVVGMECTSCHQDRNLQLSRVPGAPGWHLAPSSMAWVGLDPAGLCAQLKDPARNGNKTLEQIVEHSKHDALVAWGWAPGGDREPAPGSQSEFGALVAAWVASGAACPLPASAAQTAGAEVP